MREQDWLFTNGWIPEAQPDEAQACDDANAAAALDRRGGWTVAWPKHYRALGSSSIKVYAALKNERLGWHSLQQSVSVKVLETAREANGSRGPCPCRGASDQRQW